MRFLVVFFFLVISCLSSGAQSVIQGRVVIGSNGVSVPGASVFIANSSKGTVTNSTGEFELRDIPSGKHELIISSVGYETNVYPFSSEQLPLRLKVELVIKVRELENVLVEPSVEEGWDKWGKTFTDNFIGTTENAAQCRIRNTDKIRFRFYKKSNRVIAYADEPLIMENKALGYTIRYQLEEFEVSFKEGTTFFMGYPLFEDYTRDGKEPKAKWVKRREEAYNGSITHFMYSVYNNRLAEEGFEVRRMTRVPNLEKQRVRAIYKPRVMTIGGSGTIKVGGSKEPGDSSEYYQRIMRQNDMIEIFGDALLTADSLIVETSGTDKLLYFKNHLYVTYKRELEDELYIRWSMQNRPRTFQRSFVYLYNEDGIVIDKHINYYNPRDFVTSAYWGWGEKMANSLPIEYRPGQ